MRSVMTFLLALCLGPLLSLAPAAAQTANPAEKFVSETIRSGLTILNDASLDAGTRETRFERFLLDNTDLNRIALFALGTAQATPAQRDAFVMAFNGYAISVYRSYFRNYGGQSLVVTGSRQNAPGDFVVRTLLTDASGTALPVDFRIRTDGPKPLVLDVGFVGVWLAVTQHDDFAAFLARHGGNVTALTDDLAARAKSVR